MARQKATRYAFNRGIISPLALARVDLKRSALSAEIQHNWMPRSLGSMMLRCGLGYIGASAGNAAARHIEFIRALSAIYILEFTTGAMRVWSNDALLTRVAVSSAVTNGNFDANLANWTDSDEAGGASAWVAGGYMGLTGNGTAAAIRDQQVAVIATDQAKEHALRIVVQRGPVVLRVGSTAGGDEYINEVTLGTGTHSLAWTQAGASFYIRFLSRLKRLVLVDSCNVEAAGVVAVTSPYLTADLDYIRANTDSLSVDVMFVACVGYQQRRIERRNNGRSWSIVLYQPDDGPFRSANTGTQTMTPSVLSGNGTLTSSVPFFRTTHVGALFTIDSTGQTVNKSMTALNDATNSIRVTGVGTDRAITVIISGLTATGNTVVLQRSFDNVAWVAVPTLSYVADITGTYTDGLDNQIVYYRLLCSVYAAGATDSTLSIPTGTITGVGRVTAYTTPLVVDIEVLVEFGATNASDSWAEGKWSDFRGWPSAGVLSEGRMSWGGYDSILQSVSDAFDAFDPNTVGDSGPINRTIGSGPMTTINWMLMLQRLILGAEMAEYSVRSNAFDEPLTPSNWNCKACSGQGSAPVQAVRVDTRGVFVQRGGTRVFELSFDTENGYDYHATDLTILNPEVCEARVVRMAVQRKPDTRIHCVLADGSAGVLVYDHAEQVMCWITMDSTGAGGLIEDVVVVPGGSGVSEDRVYYSVHRTINGSTVRYFEKMALESECQGGTLNKQADAFITVAGGSATVNGLTHLIGATVVVWGNAKDLGTYTVDSSGQITLTETLDANGAVVGLYYEAPFRSAKLGQALSEYKSIDHIAPVLKNTHAQGLLMGQDFDNMDNLPLVYQGTEVDGNRVYSEYDEKSQEFPGSWSVDARICLKAFAPRPCTILALSIEGQVSG